MITKGLIAAGIWCASMIGLRLIARSEAQQAVFLPEFDPILPALRKAATEPPLADDWADTGKAARRAAMRDRWLTPPREVQPARAVELLFEFANAQGCTGYFTAPEIDELWECALEELDVARINATIVRKAFPNRYSLGQRRLNSPEFALVKFRNPNSVRPVLYKIPKIQGVRSQSGDVSDCPEPVRISRRPSGIQSGPNPDAVQTDIHRSAAA